MSMGHSRAIKVTGWRSALHVMFGTRGLWSQLITRCQAIWTASSGDAAAIAQGSRSLSSLGHQPDLYRLILETQSELICRHRADTTIEYANPAYCRYFGVRQEDIINRSYQPTIHAADRDAVAQHIQQLTRDHPQVVFENRVIANGEVRWTRWTNQCLCDETGTIVGYQSVGQDIHELKLTEQRLRDSEQRYRTLLETIPQLVWVAKADGIATVAFSHRWCDYTGQPIAAAQGHGWLAKVHPADVDTLRQRWAAAIAAKTHYECEYRLQRADGQYVWHLAQAEPTRDERGQIVRWYGTCTDISDRKRSELERHQADSARQDLNRTLEEQIAERTAELATSNQALQREMLEHRAANDRLKTSEDRFRRAVLEAPFPILIHAEDGRILQISQAVSELTGYSAEEIPTITDWTALAYGDRQLPVMVSINRLYDSDRRVDEGEYVVRTRWGRSRVWLFSSAPLGRLPDGTRLVISMAADVTQQKQTEKSLAARLRQQAVVAQLSQTALLGLDLQTLFDQATQLLVESLPVEYAKVLELQPDGRSLRLRSGVGWHSGLVGTATVTNDARSQAGYTLQNHQAVIVKDLQSETRFQGPPLLTNHQVVSGMSIAILSGHEQPFGVLGVHSTQQRSFTQDDVNFLQATANLLAAAIERKRTEGELDNLNQTLEHRIRDRTRALEEVNEELRAFSYSVAHDLRAPLRAIQGFAHVLQEDYGTDLDDLGQEYIQRMGASAEHLDELIQDLLTYSQLGRAEITLRSVDAALLCEQVIDDLTPKIQARSAHVDIATDWPRVYAQRSILRQVLGNLLSNALKFVPPEVAPHIKIWAEPRSDNQDPSVPCDRRVRIWVQDNGIGVAPRHHQRIFSPFERLHGAESYPGTGIGLSIVKRAVERMHGLVGLESLEHQGSRFWIELTVADS